MNSQSTTDELRSAFLDFFVQHDHVAVPASPLVPTHRAAPLFTNCGMVQFIPYFLGEETPPYSRATSAQPSLRIKGKNDDIEIVGRATRHLRLFELLGKFRFGDYF